MRIPNEAVLNRFRVSTRCDICGLPIYTRAEPHHIWPRGMSDGTRIDHPWNILSTHPACHVSAEAGNVRREVCWLIAALREKVPVEVLKLHIRQIAAAPKDASYVNGQIILKDGSVFGMQDANQESKGVI